MFAVRDYDVCSPDNFFAKSEIVRKYATNLNVFFS